MKYKKNIKKILIFCVVVFLCCILIYGMGNKKNLEDKSQEIFKGINEEEMELINNLDLLENFDIFVNFEFFEDIAKENE